MGKIPVLVVEQVIDRRVTVTMVEHDLNEITGCKPFEPTLPRMRDLI
jgi:hypothetical protein